jgi:hypothetical protein
MNEEEIRDLLREMREEPVPAESLARVRLRVDARVRRRSRWKVATWSLACVTVILVTLLVERRPASHAAPAPVVTAKRQEIPATVTPPVAVRPAILRKKIHRTRPAAPSVVIRMETADPDVVILLVSQ